MNKHRARSAPVYLHRARGTVSLVFEAKLRCDAGFTGARGAPKIIGKPDVYVIDGDGVRLVRHRSRILGAFIAGIATCFVTWAMWRLLQGNRQVCEYEAP